MGKHLFMSQQSPKPIDVLRTFAQLVEKTFVDVLMVGCYYHLNNRCYSIFFKKDHFCEDCRNFVEQILSDEVCKEEVINLKNSTKTLCVKLTVDSEQLKQLTDALSNAQKLTEQTLNNI